MKKSVIIKNVTVVTVDGVFGVIENGGILVKNGLISAVFSGAAAAEKAERAETDALIIDGKGGILMPGMVNAHTHAAMAAFRGLADDVPDRLVRYIFPLEKKLVTADLVAAASRYGIAEMLLSGVTTFCDMYYFEEEVARGAKELGSRAVCAETVVNFPAPDSLLPYGGIDYARSFTENWKGDTLITPGVAPHASYTVDEEHLLVCRTCADTAGIPLVMHVAETASEAAESLRNHDVSPIRHFADIGLFDGPFIAAHCIHAGEADLDILAEKGVGVSHNIGSNSKAGKGIAPLLGMWRRGVKVGLGTDGPMSGNTLDLFTQMSLAGKIHKLHHADRSVFPTPDLVELGTLGGARALGMDTVIGSIAPGKKADLVILETASVNMQPLYDPGAAIVYAANPRNVDTVLVDGDIVVKGGVLVSADFEKIRADFLAMAAKVRAAAKAIHLKPDLGAADEG